MASDAEVEVADVAQRRRELLALVDEEKIEEGAVWYVVGRSSVNRARWPPHGSDWDFLWGWGLGRGLACLPNVCSVPFPGSVPGSRCLVGHTHIPTLSGTLWL